MLQVNPIPSAQYVPVEVACVLFVIGIELGSKPTCAGPVEYTLCAVHEIEVTLT